MLRCQYLYQELLKLIPKVLPLIDPAMKTKYFPKEFDKYPILSYKENGFPDLNFYPKKIDISDVFQKGWGGTKPLIDLEDYEEFGNAVRFCMQDLRIKPYFEMAHLEDENEKKKFLEWNCQGFIRDLVERYYYLHGTEFDESKFKPIFELIDNFFSSDKLQFDISIPILFVHFDIDAFNLAPNIIVRRISEDVQKARYKIVGYSPAIVSSVFMSATHELVLKDYFYERSFIWFQSPFTNANIYPSDIVEKFFTILKIVTDYTSGYAQFIVNPQNWADSYYADLTDIDGASTRSYPSYFDDFYWNEKTFPKVSTDQLKEVSGLFSKALQSKENKLEFALKRFYKSIMRQEEEDVIIDLIIALEILLSDNEKTEITHKLALRMGALIPYYNSNHNPIDVFARVKKIYAHRSSIVHGSHRVNKTREIKIEENASVPIVNLAKDYLREVLKIVIKEPKYLDPLEIDKLLLIK